MAIQTDATLMNMTIQNYTTTSYTGYTRYNAAGINIGGIRGSYTGNYGSMVIIQGVKFYNNSGNSTGNYGGAISTVPNYAGPHTIYIYECIFLDNEATSGWGGAIATADGVDLKIRNSYFSDNYALSGGAMYFGDYSSNGGTNYFYLTNNTIWRNHASYSTTNSGGGGTFYGSGGISTYTSSGQDMVLYVRNNLMAYNAVGGINNAYNYDYLPYNSSQVGDNFTYFIQI